VDNAKTATATIHTNAFLKKENAIKYLLSIIDNFNNIVVVNKKYLDTFCGNKFILIRNAVDFETFDFRVKTIPNQDVKIFFPNLANEKNKNFIFAKRVIEILNKADIKRNYLLYYCGETSGAEKIIPLGHMDHSKMIEWYHLCDFSLIPSLSESCSLCFLESLASGCYPLANNIVGMKEYSPNNDFLFSVENPEYWVNKIRELLANWDSYKKTVRLGYEWIKNNFSLKRMASEYERVWRRCFL
jgi:glycosyltransferase involved in cell wall biosynthesis